VDKNDLHFAPDSPEAVERAIRELDAAIPGMIRLLWPKAMVREFIRTGDIAPLAKNRPQGFTPGETGLHELLARNGLDQRLWTCLEQFPEEEIVRLKESREIRRIFLNGVMSRWKRPDLIGPLSRTFCPVTAADAGNLLETAAAQGDIPLAESLVETHRLLRTPREALKIGAKLLVTAAQNGQADFLGWLDGKLPDEAFQTIDESGRTLLHQCKGASGEALEWLVREKGLDPDQPDRQGDTPLHVGALEGADSKGVPGLVRCGANLEARNGRGETPLLSAAFMRQPAQIRALLEAGASVKARDFTGRNPILRLLPDDRNTVEFGYGREWIVERICTCLDILVRAGVDPATADSRGRTAVTLAFMTQAPEEVVRALYEAGSPLQEIHPGPGGRPFRAILRGESLDLFSQLLARQRARKALSEGGPAEEPEPVL
jgi:ankyrin repeat protein